MRFGQLVLLIVLGVCASAAQASAQASVQPSAQASGASDTLPSTRSFVELRTLFRQGHRPSSTMLIGSWTMRAEITRERDYRTKKWRERSTGARREKLAGQPFEWTIDIRPGTNNSLVLTSHTPWEPTNDTSLVRFREAEITFEKDFGGDDLVAFQCRATTPRRLVCFNDWSPLWQGLEFTRDPE